MCERWESRGTRPVCCCFSWSSRAVLEPLPVSICFRVVRPTPRRPGVDSAASNPQQSVAVGGSCLLKCAVSSEGRSQFPAMCLTCFLWRQTAEPASRLSRGDACLDIKDSRLLTIKLFSVLLCALGFTVFASDKSILGRVKMFPRSRKSVTVKMTDG